MDLEKPKKRFNSKAKGANNELRACNDLGLWVGVKFHRVPASGGLRWGKDNRVCGDIISESEFEFPFVVEVKSRKRLALKPETFKTKQIFDFWLQVLRDSTLIEKRPFLMMRQNGMKKDSWYIGLDEKLAKQLIKKYKTPIYSIGQLTLDKKTLILYVFLSEVIFNIPYESFTKLIKTNGSSKNAKTV